MGSDIALPIFARAPSEAANTRSSRAVSVNEQRGTQYHLKSDEFKSKPRLLLNKAFKPLGKIKWDTIYRDPEEDISWEKH